MSDTTLPSDLDAKTLTVGLVSYLQEYLSTLRQNKVRDGVADAEVVWLADGRSDFGDAGLEIPRPPSEAAPVPPTEVRTLLTDDGWRSPDEPGPRLVADADDRVRELYDRWIQRWHAWAAEENDNAQVRAQYAKLDMLRREAAHRSDTHELVLGAGLLTLAAQDRWVVRRHLLVCEVTVTLDTATETLHVALPGTPSWRLEDRDFLTANDGFVADRSSLAPPEVLAPDMSMQQWLVRWRQRSWGTELVREESRWDPPQQQAGGDVAVLRLAPAVMLRPRSQTGVLRMYEAIAADLNRAGRPVPVGLANLVVAAEPAGDQDLPSSGLFPLESNPEQRRVLEKLRTDRTVVVQGPPGTGKTHTIANLICALLADGQRVLITSQKDQALKVLRDKIPENIRQLCVLMTGMQRTGTDELTDSLVALSELLATVDESTLEQQIDALRRQRRDLAGQIRNLTAELRAVRAREYLRHPVFGADQPGLTLAETAQMLVDGRDEHAWIEELPFGASAQPPLTDEQALELLRLLRSDTAERAQRREQQIPGTDELPAAARVAAAVAASAEGYRVLGVDADDPVWAVTEMGDADLAEICRQVDVVSRAMAGCGLSASVAEWDTDDWRTRAVEALVRRRDAAYWNTLFDDAVAVTRHEAALAAIADRGVVVQTGPGITVTPRRLLPQALQLRRYLSTGGRIARLIRPRAVAQAADLLAVCTVEGLPPETREDVDAVIITLRAEIAVEEAFQAWAEVGARLAPGALRRRVAQLHDIAATVTALRQMLAARDIIDDLLRRRGVRYGIGDVGRWDLIVRLARAVAQLRQARTANRLLAEFEDTVAGWAARFRAAPELARLSRALRERNVDAFTAVSGELEQARGEQDAGQRLLELMQQLEKAHPGLTEQLRCDPHAEHWPTRLGDLSRAWRWVYARQLFDENRDNGTDRELERRLDEAERRLLMVTRDLGGRQAALLCKRRTQPHQRIALQEFRAATNRLGKGTSDYKARYQQAVREAMDKARDAVPAWVMPLSEVADKVPARPDVFDVVIVDEASQVPVEALYLGWLAPRIVVVGDEEQCTPRPSTATDHQSTFRILDRHLGVLDIAHRNVLGPNSNLYELMSARTPETIRLTEHFRSMPEIIGWSSKLCYQQRLVPLRQFGAQRPKPLQVVHVPDAVEESKETALRNEAEADAIVDTVAKLIADPDNHRRSIGVVVMQDCRQTKMIDDKLRDRIDDSEYERRKLRVGTAPDFQGEERDIMLLSLVATHRRTILRAPRDKRHYNVAASRARDQMWLFTSMDMSTLDATDLRSRLYRHMLDPRIQDRTDPAHDAVNRYDLREPFESITQQRIFRELRDRGYEVIAQYELDQRRIDLLIVGDQGRLAVECDGPSVRHTPDELAADIGRDKELRRCDWRIVRIRESEFVFDPDAALAPLWEQLQQRGIHPHSDAKGANA
ncbi:AAA domain-containing protein [Actinoplanes sp. NPDC020271]|uniref:AAA domain-containing protein n=1 Tax=Actinoplanes sp. NPDC020271 TaxID=3363896 RepID=UPI00378B473A